jgi:hypothetical protein
MAITRLLQVLAASTILIVSSAAFCQAASPSGRDSHLDGEWRGLAAQSSLKTQLALSLFRDGSYVRRMVIVNEYVWTAEPNRLNIAPVIRKENDVDYGKTIAMEMRIDGSSFMTRVGKDSIVLYRLGPATSDSSIIGRWSGETAAGEEVIEEFAPDGQLLIMVTLARDAGHFVVAKDAIQWRQQIPDDRKSSSRFKMDGVKLKLYADSGGPPVELIRAPVQIPAEVSETSHE